MMVSPFNVYQSSPNKNTSFHVSVVFSKVYFDFIINLIKTYINKTAKIYKQVKRINI